MVDRLPHEATPAELSHLEFALALHRVAAADPAESSCISPYSVAAALGLLATGAAGRTRTELATLLAGSGELDALVALLRDSAELDASGSTDNPPEIATSAALWTAPELTVTDAFRDTIANTPNGAVHQADFAADPDAARKAINDDVAHTTHGLIEELLPPGVPARSTAALLVTALYLRASWLHRFPEHGTAPRPFHAPSGTREVPTMRQTEHLGYARVDGWQVVGLPAAGGVRAVLLLPDGDLADLESDVDAPRLAGLLAAQRSTRLDLHLPKVSVRLDTSLTTALIELGAGTMFTDSADFSGVSTDPLAVSEVLHSAVLRMDESGVEGAAATAVAMRMTAVTPPAPDPVEVRVDRPFLVLLRHVRTGAVYFLGRVTEP